MTRIDRKRALAQGCALALALAAGSARADSSDMEWLGIVYVWAADIEVEARDRNADISFSDTVENLEIGFQGHVEAQAEDFGGFVDVVFMGVGSNDVRQGIRVNTDVDLTAMDLALVWSPSPEPMTGIEVFGGLRYVDQDFGLVIDPEPPGPPVLQTGVDKSYLRLAGRRALRRADQRAVAPGVQRRPVRGRYGGHLEPRRLRRLPDRPAPVLCRLSAPRNGLRRRRRGDRHRDLFRAHDRLRIRILRYAGKQLKNKQKAGFF